MHVNDISLFCCNTAITSDTENITKGRNVGEKSLGCFYSGRHNSDNKVHVLEVTGLDAGEEAQIKASRDLDGLQSHRGGCEGEGDGEDLLGVHHQSG